MYVLYTGDRKTRPAEITLRKEFFPKETDIAIDVKVKVLYGTNEDDVISQYVVFSKVYDEQRKLYGRTRDAILETIKICKDKNVLKDYLDNREKEVVDMLMTLFDEEQIMKNHDADLTREVTKENQISSIRNLMQTLKLTAEQAMDALMIPAAEQAALLKKI